MPTIDTTWEEKTVDITKEANELRSLTPIVVQITGEFS